MVSQQQRANRAPIPPGVRAAVLQRCRARCEHCGGRRSLQMHHTTYNLCEVTGLQWDYGEPVFGHETPDVLLALCQECHTQAHITPWGEFIGDIDEYNEEVEHWHHLWEQD